MTKHVQRTMAAVISVPLLLLTVAGAAAAEDVTPPKPTTTIKCEESSSGLRSTVYDGESASYLYDERFEPGPELTDQELSDHTPQGVAWWRNWDGQGNDLLLVSSYGGDKAHLVGLDPTGATVGTVEIEPRGDDAHQTHAGALAVNDRWVFVDGPKDPPWHTIRKYSLSDLREAMVRDGSVTPHGDDRPVYGASFMTIDGRHLYAGKWSKDGRDWMYSYTIADDGTLTLDRKADGKGLRWEVPQWTQGVAVADGRFIFSSSRGRDFRSNLYITDKGETNLDKASVRCFRAPSMSEGITTTPQGEAYLMFESGARKFATDGKGPVLNVINGAHRARLSSLTSLPGGRIHLGTLHSAEQEDFFGDDDIQIRVEGQSLGDSVQIGEGERKGIDETIQFTGRVSITLYEKDIEGDDFLGKHVLGPSDQDGIMEFTKDGARYRLSYRVS